MPKRKAAKLGDDAVELRRSSRRAPSSSANTGSGVPTISKPKSTTTKKAAKKLRTTPEAATELEGEEKEASTDAPKFEKKSKSSKGAKATTNGATSAPDATPSGRQYWLMKAEPESRIEKGHDIKFSIDDLAAKTVPEPWDGIRSYPARNNLRSMKKGDLAFFYHSSCKIPAIVGTMEIVKEHSPDLSAHDSSRPYYDASSTAGNPKWSVVHVVFKQKLETPVTLKELKEWQKEKGNPLEEMQMLKLGRLSVTKVREEEWRFLVEQMKERGDIVKE